MEVRALAWPKTENPSTTEQIEVSQIADVGGARQLRYQLPFAALLGMRHFDPFPPFKFRRRRAAMRLGPVVH